MKTMSERFIKKWDHYRFIMSRAYALPTWMYTAIQHDANIRCKDSIIKLVND